MKCYDVTALKIKLIPECGRDINMTFRNTSRKTDIRTAVRDTIDSYALVTAASHAVTHRRCILLRIHEISAAESLCSFLISNDRVSVGIFIIHKHILIVRKHHLRCSFTVIVQRIGKTECKAEHQFREYYAEDQHNIIRYILKKDP